MTDERTMMQSTWTPLTASRASARCPGPEAMSLAPASGDPPAERGAGSRGTSSPAEHADATRFRGMVDAHFDFVWRYLRGLGVPDSAADDAAQQVFWIAAQKIGAIAAGSERSFLVGTAHGVASNARQAHARRREVADGERIAEQVDVAPNPEEETQSREAIAVLDSFLDSLADDLRAVFILFELEGMTMAAIAESLGVPPGTVASRLRRAREEFQAMTKRFQSMHSREGRS